VRSECEWYDYEADPWELDYRLADGREPPTELVASLEAQSGRSSTGCPTPTGSEDHTKSSLC
jgi:hypothetical protein